MSHWITIREFPLHQDLSELAQFIQRCQLPLRISEENNRQLLSAADPRLRDLMEPLLDRWSAGQLNLADVRVEPVPEPAVGAEMSQGAESPEPAAAESGGGAEPSVAEIAPPPSWPWQRTPVSLFLIALCFLGWLLVRQGLEAPFVIYPERGGDFDLANSTLAGHWARGEYWRLWTPAILHFSFLHALFNALGVWILGRPLEARAGSFPFAVLVLVSAAVSNLAQYFWSPQIVFGGMSGVLYALVGSVFILQRWRAGWRDVPAGMVAVLVAWLLLCATGLVTYIFGVGVANAAHIGGFVCGIVLTLLYCLAGGAKNFPDKISTSNTRPTDRL